MKQRKMAARLLAGFLAVMFLCTLVSRGLYASGLPQIVTQTPDRRSIRHVVEAEGAIAPGKELAVNVPQGIRVREVLVEPGDEVGPRTLLFAADQADLGELIKKKELEIEKLRLSIENMERNEKQDQQKRSLDQKRAAEDAAGDSQNESRNVERRQQDLQKAEEELARHLAEQPEITGQTERDRQNREYDSRLKEEKELQRQIIELEQERLLEYRRIYEAGGEIYGEQPGIVTEVGICPGERTSDSSVIRYASQNSAFRLKASLTKEQKKYVNPGDQAEVSLGNGRKLDLEITYLAESQTVPGAYDLRIDLPGQEGVLGMSGSLRVKTQSDSYGCCVPIEALYSENQRYYVYAVGHKQTVLGEELAVEKVPVTVLDQNEKYAALEPGVITEETEVIVRSDKEVKEGEIVRYME